MLKKNRFIELWQKLCGTKPPAGLCAEIMKAYSEEHRAYHNAEHIAHCLEELDHVPDLARQPLEVEMALWFHDAVYDTHTSDNEEKSAAWAQQALRTGHCPTESVVRIYDLILTTKHDKPLIENDPQLIADIDLSSLGQSEPEFLSNERNIRAEYRWLPEKSYREERIKVIQNFLQRKHIYFTDYFEALYGLQARKNLIDALNRLS
ncbi:MAG: N-methyl-D-aspartate receptor NMDAR2C subunit [Desulfobacteraceae bacterium]|nr:MAG: N-methyl-D-aspartate receptor NMDAR2C subunit [Desulfobacteraceae bacterium]